MSRFLIFIPEGVEKIIKNKKNIGEVRRKREKKERRKNNGRESKKHKIPISSIVS